MKTILGLFGSTLVATVLAFNLASAGEEAQWPKFEEMDTDQNGQLSTEEATSIPQLASAFTQADADQDGQLNPDEYERAKGALESQS